MLMLFPRSLSQPSGAGGEDQGGTDTSTAQASYINNESKYKRLIEHSNEIEVVPIALRRVMSIGVTREWLLSIIYPNPPGPGDEGHQGREVQVHRTISIISISNTFTLRIISSVPTVYILLVVSDAE